MILLLFTLFAALTENQIDMILGLIGKVIDHIPAILTMIGTLFLIIRQWLNKQELSKKIDANTEVSVKAFDAANSHNEKITQTQELAKVAVETVKTAVEAIAATPKEVIVKSDSDHPVHTTGGK